MSAVPKTKMTEAEYLAFERSVEARHEFHHGDIFAMSGASGPHITIADNVSFALKLRMQGHPCRVATHDLKVKSATSSRYVYPDIVIGCPPFEYLDEREDTLLNPHVVIEVLSPTTEAYDRGAKFDLYREAASLKQYVLVAQDRQHVVSYVRQSDGVAWLMMPLDDPNASVEFPTLGFSIPLTELYRDVKFSPNEQPQPPVDAATR